MMLRTLGAAAVIAALSNPVLAGGMAEPMMEAEVVAEESTGSSGGVVIPLLLLAILVAVSSGSGDSPAPVF